MKYNEDVFLDKVKAYIDSTYDQHYVGDNGIQALDVWHSLGSAQTTVRDTALKYLMRFGKKDGYNEKDILKAIHYLVLLHYFTYSVDGAKGAPDTTEQKSPGETVEQAQGSYPYANIGGGGGGTASFQVPQHDLAAAKLTISKLKKPRTRGWLINNDKALP